MDKRKEKGVRKERVEGKKEESKKEEERLRKQKERKKENVIWMREIYKILLRF